MLTYTLVYVCASVVSAVCASDVSTCPLACVCICVRERAKERKEKIDRERQRERERECVCLKKYIFGERENECVRVCLS